MFYACSYCASYSQILNCVCVCVCACACVLFFLLYCFYGHFVWNKLHDDDDDYVETLPWFGSFLLFCIKMFASVGHIFTVKWKFENKAKMCSKDECVARQSSGATKLRGYCIKIHHIFTKRRGVIAGVNACIRVAIRCGMPAHRMKVAVKVHISSNRDKNRLPWQSPSSIAKKVRLMVPTHMCTYPEHLVKTGPVGLHSEIIGLPLYR